MAVLVRYALACSFFAGKGYPVMEMDGGIEAWKDYELPLETGKGKIQAA